MDCWLRHGCVFYFQGSAERDYTPLLINTRVIPAYGKKIDTNAIPPAGFSRPPNYAVPSAAPALEALHPRSTKLRLRAARQQARI